MASIDVLTLLPHRYPFLLVDRIIDVEPGRRATGVKLVTGGEWCSDYPRGVTASGSMPHTLIIEALAQLTAAILVGLVDGASGTIGYFLGFDRVRCRGAVIPGDEIHLAVELIQFRRGVCRTHGIARVGDQVVVRADLTTVVRAADQTTAR